MNIALFNICASGSGGVIDRLQAYAQNGSQSIAQQQLADPDYWGSVGIITVTGLLIVFIILAILIFFFWLMGTVFKSVSKKQEQPAPAPAPKPEPAIEEISAEAEDEEDADEIIAVISAAVAAISAEEGVAYSIKDVRRRGDNKNRNIWRLTGIGENTRPFKF